MSISASSVVTTAELWIAGDGDLRPRLEGLACEVGVASAVRFFGYVSEAQKQDSLRQARAGGGSDWERMAEAARRRYEARYTAEQFKTRLARTLFPSAENSPCVA